MNVPTWKPTWWRRAQLLWIVPLQVVLFLPFVIYYGVKEVGLPGEGMGEVWKGRPR